MERKRSASRNLTKKLELDIPRDEEVTDHLVPSVRKSTTLKEPVKKRAHLPNLQLSRTMVGPDLTIPTEEMDAGEMMHSHRSIHKMFDDDDSPKTGIQAVINRPAVPRLNLNLK